MKQDQETGKRRGRRSIKGGSNILKFRISDDRMEQLITLANTLKAQEGINITPSHLGRVAIAQFLDKYQDINPHIPKQPNIPQYNKDYHL